MDFSEIYNEYYAKVRRFILTFVKEEWVADDLIQETFVRIQENLDTIKDPSRISSWMTSWISAIRRLPKFSE